MALANAATGPFQGYDGSELQALQALAALLAPQYDPVTWAHKNFNVIETPGVPIQLLPHQQTLLRYMFNPISNYQTMVYSTVKKSGKTTIASLVARWVAETWGRLNEVYCMANDLEQARGRIYNGVLKSIELDNKYNKFKRELPGRWKIIERQMLHSSDSVVKAVSSDYKGEAGSNPTATFWSELWGYESEDAHRLWDELTPVPTRARSIRYVETYAGYVGESDLLEALYDKGLKGRRLTHEDLAPYGGWPFPDQPPIWVRPDSRMVMYWDSGATARRMPWQTPEYYAAQAIDLRPLAFDRLHLNLWTSSVDSFIPIEWWDACYDSSLLPLAPGDRTPVVLAADAAVSSDCAALSMISRHPTLTTETALRGRWVWQPGEGEKLDYTKTIEPTIRDLISKYNVVCLPYDEYQLHDMMTRLRNEGVVWVKQFSQGAERTIADKQLYDNIRDRKFHHNDNDPQSVMRQHIQNAAGKQSKEEDTRLRIIKKAAQSKIDLTVATSMANHECLRLNLG